MFGLMRVSTHKQEMADQRLRLERDLVDVAYKQGKRGNWRAEVSNSRTGELVLVSPVRGYETCEDCEEAIAPLLQFTGTRE